MRVKSAKRYYNRAGGGREIIDIGSKEPNKTVQGWLILIKTFFHKILKN